MKNNILEIIWKPWDELNMTFVTDENKMCEPQDAAKEVPTYRNQRDP